MTLRLTCVFMTCEYILWCLAFRFQIQYFILEFMFDVDVTIDIGYQSLVLVRRKQIRFAHDLHYICFAIYSRRGFKMCFIIDTDTHSSNRFSRPFNNIVCCMQEYVVCERCCECQYAHTAWLVWSSAMFNAYISRDFSHQSNIFGFFFFYSFWLFCVNGVSYIAPVYRQ